MYTKVTVAGNIIEIYEYEKLNVNGPAPNFEKLREEWFLNDPSIEDLPLGFEIEEDTGQKETAEENYQRTQRRRRTLIRQLVCENFDVQHSKFITLTFDNQREYDIKDVSQCNIAFDLFMHRLKYKYPELKYVAVIEFQDKNDRGAVHYHMVCNLPYIKKTLLGEIWGQGFVKINDIDKVDNLGAYITKYMNKHIEDKRLQRLKAYNCSKGLKRPLEIKSWLQEDRSNMKAIKDLIKAKSPVYCSEYTSEKCGKMIYRQYNLIRK